MLMPIAVFGALIALAPTGCVDGDADPINEIARIVTSHGSDVVSGMTTFTMQMGVKNQDAPVNGVEFLLNGQRVGTVYEFPFSLEMDTTAWEDGEHEVSASAVLQGETVETSLTVISDNEPPVVEIISPQEGYSIDTQKEKFVFAADVQEDAGEAEVVFYINNQVFCEFDAPPYRKTVDLSELAAYEDLDNTSFRVEAKSPAGLLATKAVGFSLTRRFLWTKQVEGLLSASPVIAGENIVVAKGDGTVLAFGTDGSQAWTFGADNPLFAGVTLFPKNERLYFGDTKGILYCLRFDGALAWKLEVGLEPGVISEPPFVVQTDDDNEALIGISFYDGRAYSVIERRDRAESWDIISDRESHLRSSVILSSEGGYFVAYEDGVVIGGNKDNQREFSGGEEQFWSSPVVSQDEDYVIVGGKDGSLYQFSLVDPDEEPTTLHTFPAAVTTRPALLPDQSIVLGTPGGALYQVMAEGDISWQISAESYIWIQPLFSDTRAYMADARGRIRSYGLDGTLLSADHLWELSVDGEIVSRPALKDGALFVSVLLGDDAAQGKLYAISAK